MQIFIWECRIGGNIQTCSFCRWCWRWYGV